MIFDIGLSLILGLTVGGLVSIVLSREEDPAKYVSLIIGAVLLCIGISGFLEISYILPTMVFGVTIASITKKPDIDNYVARRAQVNGLAINELPVK